MATLHSRWTGNDSIPRETFRSLEQPPTRYHSRVSMLTKSLDRAKSDPFERRNARARVSNHFYARRSFRRSFLPRNTAAKVACVHLAESVLARSLARLREKIHGACLNNIIHNNVANTRRRSSPLGGKCYGYMERDYYARSDDRGSIAIVSAGVERSLSS